MDDDALQRLRCPRCGGALEAVSGSLTCVRCRAPYEVRGEVPDLLPWSGGVAGPEWARWRETLEALQERRRSTADDGRAVSQRREAADDLAEEFFRFARVPETGSVLEIGCGSGWLRRFVPRRRYWGIDPLLGTTGTMGATGTVGAARSTAIPASAAGAIFVRAVGERLPLADASFECVLICDTLDRALDPAQVIREARRVLKPGGVLAVMQSVRLAAPPPPLRVRLTSAAGRLKALLVGGARAEGTGATMHALDQDRLSAMVNAEMMVESGITRGTSMFLRALRQDLSAPRPPKRSVRG